MISALDDFGFSYDDLGKVLMIQQGYVKDYEEYINNGGLIDMVNNEEKMNEVRLKTKQYINGKMDKAKAIRLLKKEFNLPTAVLSDLWMECKITKKGEMKAMAGTLEHKETKFEVVSMEEVKDIKKQIDSLKFDKKPKPNKVKGIITNVSSKSEVASTLINVEDDKDLSSIPPITIEVSNLEIINRTIEVRGKYSTYVKDDKGVALVPDGVRYEKKEDVLELRSKFMSDYSDEVEAINKQMASLNMRLNDLNVIHEKEMSKCNEIEAVFDLK
jgi:citrate lyase gamma subunit